MHKKFAFILALCLLAAPYGHADVLDDGPFASIVATTPRDAKSPVDLTDQITPDIRSMYVAGDGTCYTYSAFGVADFYRDAKFLGSCSSEGVVPDGSSISGNDKYVFLSCRDEIAGTTGIYWDRGHGEYGLCQCARRRYYSCV
jgi:hypothetical protein